MTKKKILMTERIHPAGHAILDARDDVEVVIADDIRPETLAKALPGVHGIAVRTAKLPEEVLSHANALEVVSRHGVGCDNVAVDHLTARGIPVCIAAGANARCVAEHTMTMMMSLARDLTAQTALVRESRWTERNSYRAKDMYRSKILIIGYGRIGRLLAPLCKAFGMDVVVADIKLDRALADRQGVRAVEDFRPELPAADFVSLHVPLDETTRHLIGATELAAMKPGVIVINNARGGVVDERALAATLDSGHVAGAGLDVFSEEPPPADHPLVRHPKTVLAPHNGAASILASEAASVMTAQNILDHFDGRLKDEMIFNLDALKRAS
ncbi:MAG: 3-phosphoglycerate dehydrogenase [Rhodospirillales bacterium CG15_BIG_FIL_POST_REV_8_21_14_020_66_15]|nr:MAG: 3-phosphoglycerate dehydrogenase [Rhodospirillales bacterium CG15_BIG_FIL_POST_REV_8_21_14_020_66_15]